MGSRGPLAATGEELECTDPGARSVLGSGFSEKRKKLIFRICENASKNHILRNLAPTLLRQILLCFLALDLPLKNMVCQIYDTFV
jgi:hypothetical protein